MKKEINWDEDEEREEAHSICSSWNDLVREEECSICSDYIDEEKGKKQFGREFRRSEVGGQIMRCLSDAEIDRVFKETDTGEQLVCATA